jgi:ribonucleoside-diphosphate reductase alpha chain
VGFTGFGDMLIKLGLKYDTKEAIEFADQLFKRIKNIVYDESAELAVEKDTFPAFDLGKHLRLPFIQRLDPRVLGKIEKQGLRNAALLTVPPVGSGSVLAGVSSGIEPVYALNYIRRSESLSKEQFSVYHPLVKEYMRRFGLQDSKDLPKTFVMAHEIKPEMRVRMQAVIQKHIDHAISSTVNLAKDVSPEEVGQIYFEAWKSGCKGITVYREGSRRGVLLTEGEAKALAIKKQRIIPTRPYKRLAGGTYKFKTEGGKLYVTVNHDPSLLKIKDDDIAEVFIYIGSSGSAILGMAEGKGRSLSVALQSGLPAKYIIEQLLKIKVRPTQQPEDAEIVRVVQSIDQAIAVAIAIELEGGTTFSESRTEESKNNAAVLHNYNDGREIDLCPSCGGTIIFTKGCYLCRDCGLSECD